MAPTWAVPCLLFTVLASFEKLRINESQGNRADNGLSGRFEICYDVLTGFSV